MSSIIQSFTLQIPYMLIGIGIVLIIWPYSFRSNLILKLFLGIGLGAGLSSLLFFLWMLIFPKFLHLYLFFELFLLLITLVSLWLLRKKEKPESPLSFNFKNQHWIGWGFLSIFLLSVALWVLSYRSFTFMSPHGTFDAYAIWNLRARFIVRGEENWQTGVSPELNWKNHPDYPMLTPALVARSWSFLGNETTRVPIVLSAVFALGLVGLTFAFLLELRGLITASIGGLVLLSTSWFQFYPTTQNADTTLAFFYLATCGLAYMYFLDPKKRYLLLAGFMAGLAGWTKNEGIVFLLVSTCAFLLLSWLKSKSISKGIRSQIPFVLGLLFPTFIILIFKTLFASSNDMSSELSSALLLNNLLDGSRYWVILKEFGRLWYSIEILNISFLVWILIFLFILGQKDKNTHGFYFLLIVILITLAGYFSIYLITPHPLAWHLNYSADRLLYHLMPIIWLAACFNTKPFATRNSD